MYMWIQDPKMVYQQPDFVGVLPDGRPYFAELDVEKEIIYWNYHPRKERV
jgi:hypothetical protein